MTLNYEIDDRLKALTPVLDECAAWYGGVTRFIFYPELYEIAGFLNMPPSLRTWIASERGGGFIPEFALDNIQNLQSELLQAVHKAAQVSMSGEGNKPSAEIFDTMHALYMQFMAHLRRVERECAEANTGIDSATGLRHRKAMERDLANEMERRVRQGRPFALVLAHIDNYQEICSRAGMEASTAALKSASALIRKSVRSFDDAYRYAEDEFIMALKHSDQRGGAAAVTRLRDFLSQDPIGIQAEDGSLIQLSMSYCVAEPQPGENFEELIGNMRTDLGHYDDSAERALEYIEQSPLQRFVKESDEK